MPEDHITLTPSNANPIKMQEDFVTPSIHIPCVSTYNIILYYFTHLNIEYWLETFSLQTKHVLPPICSDLI